MKKKQIFIVVGILLPLLLIYGTYFQKNRIKMAELAFKNSEAELLQTLQKEANKFAGDYELIATGKPTKELLIFAPTTADKERLTPIATKMKEIGEETFSKVTQEKIPTKIVVMAEATAIHKNLTEYHYHEVIYQWDQKKKEWAAKTDTLADSMLLNNLTHLPLTLGDIFINQQNLLTVSRSIQEDLLKMAKDPKNDVAAILALPLLLVEQTNFTYSNHQLEINYPSKHYLNKHTLKFEDYGAYLNPEFVEKNYLKDKIEKTAVKKDKMIALTFDDGPSDKTTPKLLDILKTNDVPATFFMLGQQAKAFPDIVKLISEQGHEIANHSFNHPDLTTLTSEKVREQINLTQAAIYQASGILPQYVRPPYGSFNYQTAVAIGMPIVNWSVDSLDWKSKNTKKITTEVLKHTEADSIILLHDIHKESVAALDELIIKFKKEGYQFVTISDLLQTDVAPLTAHYSANSHQIIQDEKEND